MDDPWGSPWASSEPTSRHDLPTPSPPKNLLSPPPKAFFGGTSNLQIQSPWADNDGIGDWASTEQTDTADWGVWAEPSSQSSQPSPRPDEFGKRGSIAWPGNAATSPGLRPIPRSRASSVFRHHSPDPWATELSLQNDVHETPTTPLPSNALGIAALDSQREQDKTRLPLASKQDVTESSNPQFDDARSQQGGEIAAGIALQISRPASPKEIPESRNTGTNTTPKVEIHDSLSRPSSTFSRDSSGEVGHPDSPITSIDEDPKLRLQATPRKVSGKVQELVGMYDDIAKAATDESPVLARLEPSRSSSRGRSPSQTRNTEAEEDADFGDFEDAEGEYARSVADADASPTSSGRSPTPKAPAKEITADDYTGDSAEPRSTSSGISPVPVQQIIEKFGPIRFDVDMQSIDKLFPDLVDNSNDNAEEERGNEIPDRVIDDTFTTISERKTWYRISRFGPMRKHDSGDEDNYHRVDWSTSNLHSDTIKIVRRWMEEDSIAGRVTLGASKRTSAFNWDSPAAPVDLGKVFSKKASTTHSRTSSILPKQSLEGPVHSATGSPSTPKSIASPIKPPDAAPVASFGWNSSNQSHPVPSQEKRGRHTKSASQSTPVTSKPESIIHAPVQPPPQPMKTEVILEDEDEWGEMVSSPKVETQPESILKTQSLNDTNLITATPIPLVDPTSNTNGKKSMEDQSNNLVSNVSASDPQSNQTPEQPSSQTDLSTKPQQVDSWSFADFSIFENSTPAPKPIKQDAWPLDDFSIIESSTPGPVPNGSSSLESKPKHDSKLAENDRTRVSADTVEETRPPLKAVLGPIQKSDTERDQQEIVRNIIQNLPDLSYMLR